jgi:hypothetical protein
MEDVVFCKVAFVFFVGISGPMYLNNSLIIYIKVLLFYLCLLILL